LTRKHFIGLAAIAIGVTGTRQARSSEDMSTTSPEPRYSPYSDLDAKAQAVDVDKPESIEALATSVLKATHGFEIPALVHKTAHPILSRAESRHLSLAIPGVHEHDLSSTLSDFFFEMGAPAFAEVTPHQVRVVRMLALQMNPVL
jgi:hypothetical protein